MLQTMGERVAAAAALVDRLPDVALVIDTSMKIVDANAAAEACLRAGDLIGIRGSKLVMAEKWAQDWIKASFQQIALCTSLRDDRMIVQTEDGIFRLSLFAIPASALAGQTSLLQKKLCLLLIRDLGRRSETAPNLLATHYHLSAAEIRMCAELAGGSTIKDAADRLGIAWETARHRLKQIFQKTGTNRQSELVALLLRIG
ncbi:MAG: helix-turn-helix transcriptional regulator [Rhizobium sp.]|nr:helix-turn-helix transcriptional regulator [Rhizobium sp.]